MRVLKLLAFAALDVVAAVGSEIYNLFQWHDPKLVFFLSVFQMDELTQKKTCIYLIYISQFPSYSLLWW